MNYTTTHTYIATPLTYPSTTNQIIVFEFISLIGFGGLSS